MFTFLKNKILWYVAAGVIMLGLGVLKMYWTSYPDDNPIEEAAEDLFEQESGLSIDFTPGSKES